MKRRVMTENLTNLSETDARLTPFFNASDPRTADIALEKLIIEVISPAIKKIFKRKLRFYEEGFNAAAQDFEDLENEVLVFLIRRLREIKSEAVKPAIPDAAGYAATIAYNACHEYLRRKYPERARLKNKIRYALNHRPQFDLWKTLEKAWLAGLSVWNKPNGSPNAKAAALELMRHERLSRFRGRAADDTDFPELLENIFQLNGDPIELDELVTLTADLLNVQEQTNESYDAEGNLLLETIQSGAAKHDEIYEQRVELERLWTEIKELPPRQRSALLLNLTDKHGRDIISLLPFTRAATIREIAETLEIPLDDFLKIWNGLPLEDSAIAELLGITRQQVINLRKSARERLRRRFTHP